MRLSPIKAIYSNSTLLKRRLLSGSTWAFGGKVGGATVGVVTNGLLARMLSPSELGAYFLALTIISFGAMVGTLGLTKTTIRFVAESMSLDRPGRARRVILTVLGIGLLGSIGVSLAYWLVVGDLVAEYLFHSSALVMVTGLTAGWMAISVMQEITAETFRGFHDVRMATLLGGLATGGSSGGIVMRILLVVCLALLWSRSATTDLQTVMLVCVGSGSVSLILGALFLRGKLASLGPQGAQSPASPREVMRDAVPILGISLTTFVLLSADIWILGALGSNAEVAVYGATSRLVILIAMPLLVTNLVVPPIVAEMYAQGRTVELERTLRTFSTLAGVPSLLVLLAFIFLGGPTLGVVYGDGLFPSGSPAVHQGAIVLMLLSAAKMVAVWSGSCGTVLQYTGHQTSMLRVSGLTSAFFIVGALVVVRDYGPVGVASVAAATTVLQNVALVLVAKRKTGMWTHLSFSLSPLRKALANR